MLKPVDLYLLCHLVVRRGEQTQQTRAAALGISQSNVHRGLRQLDHSRLFVNQRPVLRPFRDLLVHAVRHVYPANLGPPVRGVPTAHTAPMVGRLINVNENIVWPEDTGGAVGTSIEPLHRSAPLAALQDPDLYELLALVDIFRCDGVRDREVAAQRLDALIERLG